MLKLICHCEDGSKGKMMQGKSMGVVVSQNNDNILPCEREDIESQIL